MVRPVIQGEQTPVSPKMIEAGLRAMEAWKNLPPGEVIAAVYRAMVAVTPSIELTPPNLRQPLSRS